MSGHGGKRTGAGRPKGAASLANEQVRQEAAATGELPLAYMLRIMRDPSEPSVRLLCTRRVFRLPLVDGCRNSGSANDRRARDLTRVLNRRKARMAEGSGGLGHIVTPADWYRRPD